MFVQPLPPPPPPPSDVLVRRAIPEYAETGQHDIERAQLEAADIGTLEAFSAALQETAQRRGLEIVTEWIIHPPSMRVTWRPAGARGVGVFQNRGW